MLFWNLCVPFMINPESCLKQYPFWSVLSRAGVRIAYGARLIPAEVLLPKFTVDISPILLLILEVPGSKIILKNEAVDWYISQFPCRHPIMCKQKRNVEGNNFVTYLLICKLSWIWISGIFLFRANFEQTNLSRISCTSPWKAANKYTSYPGQHNTGKLIHKSMPRGKVMASF